MLSTLQHLTVNLTPAVRHDQMEGKDYLVVPMVMLTEGVHQGSSGPLYYPNDELSKIPAVWNHKPVVVYHPKINGQGVSACDPDILTTYKIGVIMNTTYEDGKLKAEAWLDPERVPVVDSRIMEAIQSNVMMELSTGLFTDLKEEEGEWNGESYSAVAVNYRPDHLAVLPDQIGACSMADGAGFLRMNSETKTISLDCSNCSPETYTYITDNTTLIESNFFKWVETLESPEEGDNKNTVCNRKDNKMDKQKFVADLIANESTQWEEADTEALMAMDESVLEKMTPIANETAEETAEETTEETTTDEEVVANEEKELTVNEYIAAAPAGLQEVLRNGLDTYTAEKNSLISTLTANKKCVFTKEQLASKDNKELKALVTLAAGEKKETKPDYSGQADPVENTETEIEPLGSPAMTFDAE